VKLLFFGTPQEAVPYLEACAREHDVLTVVTRADSPAGRGLALSAPPVKACAQKLGIPVLQPGKPLDISGELRRLQADAAVVVAYGKILPKEVLESTRLGFLNVHFSLLPKYRGAAPIEWSLIRGETRTGVTVFWLDQGTDTGPIQAVREISVGIEEDAVSLRQALINLGVETLRESLEQAARGLIARSPQSGEPSHAPKLTREDAWVDFERPALDLHNRVRGLLAGPRAFIRLLPSKSALTLMKTSMGLTADSEKESLPAGTVISIGKKQGILIQCHPGQIWVVVVQPEGKRQIPAADFANGLRLKPGDRLAYVPHG
jgi:methionyl-tRNA formyltransferase